MPLKLTHEINSAWLLAIAASSLIAGIAIGFSVHATNFAGIQYLVIALVLLVVAIIKRVRAMILLAVAAGLLLGFWRSGTVQSSLVGYQNFIGKNITLEATVVDDTTHKNGQIGMKLNQVSIGSERLGGEIWGSASTSLSLKRGDKLMLKGKLAPGFGSFAANMSYAKIISVSRDSGGDLPRQIRDKFTGGLKRAVSEPEASLGAGYLDGQHNTLDDSLIQQLKLVGLIHLVIAGGYNVTILVRFVRRRLAFISKYVSFLAAGLVLAAILLVTGFSAPMSRTVVITILSLAALYYGRKIHPLVLLPVSAAITALIDPGFINGEVGWYLTFIAYGGLILLAPLLQRFFWGNRGGNIRQIFVDSLAVQIVVMPLLAYSFQQYSVYGVPANLLVLPLMPVTMLTTVIAGIGGVILPAGAAHIIGFPAQILLDYTYKVTTWLAGAPGADYSASFGLPLLIVSYLAIILLIYNLWRKTGYNFRDENIVE